ncbi:MAG: T9SS type A sorting domain-containing protein [Ignavibacteriales bacterium]|nr:T9SS type A sorting domain-containing protein [Ignavibacteriales bacterium]MCF8316451.1 T9SS type A sorting domain-containing protein [Ignavibacteriales bacterium]MCF8437931.1 T9SS type A sorting domain-containing protein [Ignavibacteriales bacterium]
MQKFIFYMIFLLSVVSAQNTLTYFPSEPGMKLFFENTPLDSLNQPVDELSFVRADSFGISGSFYGRDAKVILSKTGPANSIFTLPYIDSTHYNFADDIVSQYFKFTSLIDSSVIPDTGIIHLLNSLAKWYGLYKFNSNVNTTYQIFQKDTTVTFNDQDIPIRIEVTGKRLSDELISDETGEYNCKKFTLTLKLSYLIILPPPFPSIPVQIFAIPVNQWIAPDNWIVRQYIPSVSVDLSFINLPSFFIPGLETYRINEPEGILLLNPNGGTVYLENDSVNIRWLSVNVNEVNLEWSPDSGRSWNMVAAGLNPVPGSFNWTIPGIRTDSALFRIRSAEDSTVTDESDTVFSIRRVPELLLVSPNGGEIFFQNDPVSISWSSSFSDSIDISFSSDGGSSWILVVRGYPSDSSKYLWNLPVLVAETCLFRINDYRWTDFFDESDSVFTVTTPVNILADKNLPLSYKLGNVYPNPFNPTAKFAFELPEDSRVTIRMYDILGSVVRTVVDDFFSAGSYNYRIDGRGLSSGVYFIRMKSGDFEQSVKMIISK